MLLNGASLESTLYKWGIERGAAYQVAAVEPLIALVTPWQTGVITYVRLTVEQQVEMSTEELIVLPLLCLGQGGAHTHNVALMQRSPEVIQNAT